MLGLYISRDNTMTENEVCSLMEAQLIPLEGFTDLSAFAPASERDDFLRQAAAGVMRGEPIPMAGVAMHLSGPEALAGNVLRKYVCLQLSLAPYLRVHDDVTDLEGCFLLGKDLLVAPMGQDGCIDARLPDGIWTELSTGECMQSRLRRIRGLNAMPVLARENSVIPIGVNDRTPHADDADRLTLHWFQPQGKACCQLRDGTVYQLEKQGEVIAAYCDSTKPWHLIVHQDGQETLIR